VTVAPPRLGTPDRGLFTLLKDYDSTPARQERITELLAQLQRHVKISG
jgi:hypothetical protein